MINRVQNYIGGRSLHHYNALRLIPGPELSTRVASSTETTLDCQSLPLSSINTDDDALVMGCWYYSLDRASVFKVFC